ncbi:M23 family metallopeptidase [Echinicola shivajiensis]|uniref:M23 family metallopeptidase n=1 Tax=Echinicola shivajiensis TaxID=1035916 RepID=UPI001BFC639F|nr:peptidoglycan DD-metalloendopeptidase family protein [Echinicola shivajiensis]
MKKKWIAAAGAMLLAAAGIGYYQFNLEPEREVVVEETQTPVETEIVKEKNLLYGIDVDDLAVVEGVVGRNQTLSTILAPFNVPYQIIDQIAKKSKDIFDVRKIAYNKKYTVLTAKDSSSTAAFFIYEPNAAEFVVYKLDGKDIYKEAKPVEYRKREVAGQITSSLYVNMTQQGITPDLIDQFADLYGWSVDFQRLQKGDKYKVVYNERVVEGEVVGVDDIQAAFFEHMGQPYHAIPFEQNGQVSFFDEKGNSFKKAFLRDPVKFTRISSRYNLRRYHPVQKRYKAHLGTDYAAPRGTEIRAVGDGTIIAASYTGGNGNYVKVKHNGTYTTQYLHMSKIASGIRNGVRVKQGQVIGYVGSTGLATGPHLCFRFWKHGKQVDWLREEIPPSEPISEQNKLAFERVKQEKLDLLASIPYEEGQDEDRLLTER